MSRHERRTGRHERLRGGRRHDGHDGRRFLPRGRRHVRPLLRLLLRVGPLRHALAPRLLLLAEDSGTARVVARVAARQVRDELPPCDDVYA